MLNKSPIFVVGFQRGGTVILTNLLLSHPDCWPLGRETHQVFYGKDSEAILKWAHRLLYLPVLASARGHIFRPARMVTKDLSPALPWLVTRYIDALLYLAAERVEARGQALARGKSQRPPESRLVCKNVGAMGLTTPLFADMYPEATFLGLIRNGLALCEGYVRRGWTAERFGQLYRKVGEQMLNDERDRPRCHVVRFEDLVSRPSQTVETIYQYAGLDIDRVPKFAMQAQESTGKNGARSFAFGQKDREVVWFSRSALQGCFRPDVNENQIARLNPRDRDTFLRVAGPVMERLGYL